MNICRKLTGFWARSTQKRPPVSSASYKSGELGCKLDLEPTADRRQPAPATPSRPPFADPNCPQAPWPASLTHFILPRPCGIKVTSYTKADQNLSPV